LPGAMTLWVKVRPGRWSVARSALGVETGQADGLLTLRNTRDVRRRAGAQLVDKYPLILRIVDGRRHQMHAAAGERRLERRREPVAALDAATLRAVGP